MPETGGPIFYVITLRGDRGPFDRNELARQLRAGEIQAGDKVRSAFGRPLGTVAELVEAHTARHLPPQPSRQDAPAAGRRSALLVPGLAAGAVVLAGVAWFALSRPAVSPPVQPPSQPSAQPAAPQTVVETRVEPAKTFPAGWLVSDIGGAPPAAAPEPRPGGRCWIAGSGCDIWTEKDQFRFVSTPLDGDGTLTARIQSCDGAHGQAKSGVMLRATTAAGSPFILITIAPGGGGEILVRTAPGRAVETRLSAHNGIPLWLRLQRRSRSITLSSSTDGTNWVPSGEAQDLPALSGRVLAGLAVCSHEDKPMTTVFSDIALTRP